MVGRSVFGSRNEREKDDLIAVLREEIRYLEKLVDRNEKILDEIRIICAASEQLVSGVGSDEPEYHRKVIVAITKKLRAAVGYANSEHL